MLKTVMIVLPLIVALAAATVRHVFAVRLIAVAIIASCFLLGLGGLVAPHRLAQETVPRNQQNSDWDRGARDTRDVVYTFIPLLTSCFGGIVLLALRPVRQNPKD